MLFFKSKEVNLLYLFNFWLHLVLVAMHRLLIAVASLTVEHWLEAVVLEKTLESPLDCIGEGEGLSLML